MTGITYTFATQTGPIPLSELDTNFALMTNGTLNASFATVTATTPVGTASQVGAFNYGTLSYNDVNVVFSAQGSTNGYFQKIIQNTSNGTAASADYIVSNNLGTASTYYGNFGINSSTYAGAGAYNLPNAVYVSATSGDLALGTTTANGIHFFVNNGATDALAISSAGVVSTTTPATSDSSNTLATTAYVQSNTSGAFMGRNKIINGDMRVAQRGASYTLTNSLAYGSVDRWMVSGNATANSFANQNPQLGTAYQYGGCAYLLQVGRLSGATAVTPLTWQTVLESVNSVPLAGKYVCLSYYAAAGSSFTGTGLVTQLLTGTGVDQPANNLGAWTGTTQPISTLQAITTTPTRYSFTCFIPANTSQIGVYFNYTPSGTATANDYVLFSGVQLEVVPSLTSPPTQFEILDYGVEINMCRRHYQVITGFQTPAYSQSAGAVTTASIPISPMRVTPTVAISGQTYSNASNLGASAVSPTIIQTFATVSANTAGWATANFALSAEL
jgi:hypothetical protein